MGKDVHVEPITQEKKKLQELEFERMTQLDNIMWMIVNDLPRLDIEDPNKVWCYEMIDNVAYGEVDAFN